MQDSFISTSERLVRGVDLDRKRYLYVDFNLDNRLTGLIGPRGTGKTTMMLQYISEHGAVRDKSLYVSADHIYFSQGRLFDFVEDLYEDYGYRYFFIDEIHKYRNWQQELKNIYDSFPDIHVVFSGSSSMDLVKGTYDLSRRGVIFHLEGMSFREYLEFCGVCATGVLSWEELIEGGSEVEHMLGSVKGVRRHFSTYLREGYYPFFLEDRKTYDQKLLRVIDKTVFEDIANFYRLRTEHLADFKRILTYLATIVPGELNINSLAVKIGLNHRTVQHYLQILQETGLVMMLPSKKAGGGALKRIEKIYLDNPNLYGTIAGELGYDLRKGTLRELFFIRMLKNAGHPVYYSRIGDFESRGILFEVGGKSKNDRQIRDYREHAWLIKDDILHRSRGVIPLYLFGFLY